MDIIKAYDMRPTKSCITVVAGPPGLGKSWFAGTVAEVVDPKEVLVLATLEREVKSYWYQKHNFDVVRCIDDGWEPSQESFKATGHNTLLNAIKELRTDDKYGAIILDSGTDAGENAWHAALEPFGVGDPSQLSNSYAPYTALDSHMDEVIRGLSKLAGHPAGGKSDITRPKHIIITWHVQPPKDSPGAAESADQKGEGVEYEGSVLPMVRGRFRRRLMGLLDAFVYVDRKLLLDEKTGRSKRQYVIQVASDNEKHAKFPGKLPDKVTHIPNSFSEYLKLMEESLGALK